MLIAIVVVLSACGRDAADEAFYRALEGDEDGSTLEERLGHIDEAIALAPDRAGYYKFRALLRMSGCRLPGAIEDLDRSLSLADHPYQHYLRGLVYCESGDCARALDDFDAAIAAQPENMQFYRGRALARAATGDGEGALTDAEHLVADAPHGHRLYARGAALAALGRHEAAVRDFDEALRKRPELTYVLRARAKSQLRLGLPVSAANDRAEFARLTRWDDDCAYRGSPFHY